MTAHKPKTNAWEEAPGIRSSRRLALLGCVTMAALLSLVTVLAGIIAGRLDQVTANTALGFVWAFLAAAFGKAATLAVDNRNKTNTKET